MHVTLTLTVVYIVEVSAPVWRMSADVDITRLCVVDACRVIEPLEREHGVEATSYIYVVVVVERVSVRAEPNHHITARRQHRQLLMHVSTVQADHRRRQRASVEQPHVVKLVSTVSKLMSVQLEVSEL